MEKKQAVVTSDTLTKEQIRELAAKSLAGIKNSYAPYSHFHVFAVLLSENGNIYTGNNIENAAYTPSVCAERCAFFKAVSEGERDFAAIALCVLISGIKLNCNTRIVLPDLRPKIFRSKTFRQQLG